MIRTRAGEVKQSGRQTMGVRLMNLASGDSVVGLALNAESEADVEAADEDDDQGIPVDAPDSANLTGEADRDGLGAEPADDEE